LVAISVQSIAVVEGIVDVPQFRVLVIVASRGSVSLGELADAARMHLSTASRTADRLLGAGLLHRTDDPANRRQFNLTLTEEGAALVHQVLQRRRKSLEPILARMDRARRAELVTLLKEFAAAGAEPADADLWALGWTT
jgi:DNA-binding MarR family transcriptional regulator